MKVVLLAAGKGTRISRFIQDVPKCTLPINGEPLIRRTVKSFLKRGFDVVVCVGYKYQMVKKSLDGLNVKFYYNPFYAVTNSLGTLWMAKDELNDDVIVMNADVFFDEKIVDSLINNEHNCVLASDSSRCKTGDYFFSSTKSGYLVKYGKDLPLEERTSEYVGIVKMLQSFLPKFISKMNELIEDGFYTMWWENAIYSLSDTGEKILTVDYSGLFWSEVDYYDDYERILEYLKNNK